MNRHFIVTTVKNEEDFIRNTLDSVVTQTLKPIEWIIINDNSEDNTEEIIREYAAKYNWIRPINREQKTSTRKGGENVAAIIQSGIDMIDLVNADFVSKIDGDLTLPEDYFEVIAETFEGNQKAGIAGGRCYISKGNDLIPEFEIDNQVRGPIKSYRKDCLVSIGGIPQRKNWDGIDGVLAEFQGWENVILDLKVVHHRPTSSLTNSSFKNSFLLGMDERKTGYTLLLALLRSYNFGKERKFSFIHTIFFVFGYLFSMVTFKQYYFDKSFRKFLNQRSIYC